MSTERGQQAIGALAGKPVMEGKGVLFKRFADVDVFDIELEARDPWQIIQVVKAIAPEFMRRQVKRVTVDAVAREREAGRRRGRR